MAAKKTAKKTTSKKKPTGSTYTTQDPKTGKNVVTKGGPLDRKKKKGFDIASGDAEPVPTEAEPAPSVEKKKRTKAPKAARAPKLQFTDGDDEEEDGFDITPSDELSPRALELIEFETEVRNAVGHLANEYKGDAQEHEPIRCIPSRKKPSASEVFRTVESLRVGLTPEEQLARGKLAAVGQQSLARLQSLRGSVTKQIKKLEKLYTARVEALLKTVDEGHADVPVTVVHVIDKATDRVQVIRCDTGAVTSTRDLSLEERQAALPGVE